MELENFPFSNNFDKLKLVISLFWAESVEEMWSQQKKLEGNSELEWSISFYKYRISGSTWDLRKPSPHRILFILHSQVCVMAVTGRYVFLMKFAVIVFKKLPTAATAISSDWIFNVAAVHGSTKKTLHSLSWPCLRSKAASGHYPGLIRAIHYLSTFFSSWVGGHLEIRTFWKHFWID